MERLAQLLDDLDDLVSMVGLLGERLRHIVLVIIGIGAMLALQIGGILLALEHPPLALAMALILFVTLLYQSVTAPHYALALK